MNAKRIFQSPIPYILLGAIALWIGFSLITSVGYQQVTTQEGLDLLKGSTVDSAKIVDGEQRVDLTLNKAAGENGTSVQFYYVAPRGAEVVAAINEADLAKGFDDEVPQTNFFTSLLGILVPFVLIALLFWFLMSRMQGGGNRVMQFGKSKAKLVGKEAPKVTFGVSFETSFAFDLPNCMTRLPPPCMLESMNQNSRPMMSSGMMMLTSPVSQLDCGTSSSNFASLPLIAVMTSSPRWAM